MDILLILIFLLVVILAILTIYHLKIIDLFKHNSLVIGAMEEYPYKKNSMKPEDVQGMFDRLKCYKPQIQQWRYKIGNIRDLPEHLLFYNGEYRIVVVPNDSYELYDNISDYFQEHVRVKCKRSDQELSSYEFWQQNTDKVLAYASSHKTIPREALYQLHYECTSFKPSLMVAFAALFPSKRVLDISSGWGDRLIGAIASPEVEYYLGSDPNAELHDGYKEIVKFFGASDDSYKVFNGKFQDVDLSQEDPFDLVFTSPPYFNLEEYARGTDVEQKQSHIEFSNVDAWVDGFLMPCLKKAFGALRVGGHMIININDPPSEDKYVQRMIETMTQEQGCIYMGCIAQQESSRKKSPQPFWIWRKVDNIPDVTNINPKLVIDTLDNDMKVVRDDLLMGGTKQRGIVNLFDTDADELVYAGPNTGFAQIALAIGARLTGKKATVFVSRIRPMTPMTLTAIRLGANVIEGAHKESLSQLRAKAAEYVKASGDHVAEAGFGFDDPKFKAAMIEGMRTASEGVLDTDGKHVFWLVGGSAVLTRILYEVFPNSWFNVVQVGKQIDWYINFDRSRLFVAPEWFYDPAQDPPPYPSVRCYDAKVWQFASKYGKSGDIIWNVAKDPVMDDLSNLGTFKNHDDGWTNVRGKKRNNRRNKRF